MGSKKKKNLLPSQKNKEKDVCKSRSKKSVMSMLEPESFSTGTHNVLPGTSGTVQASKKRTKKFPNVSNSQLRPYVDDLTDDDDDEEMMTPEHKTRLNDCFVDLVENMIPHDVLNFLLAKKVLTSHEMDLIKSKRSRRSMNKMLISLVKCKSDKAFSVLVEVLKKTQQKHLAKLLTSEKRKRKPAFEGNEGVTEEQKAIQKPPISAKVEKRIPRQNIPPKGRKALKEIFPTGEKMPDQPQGIPVSQRNLRKYTSDPLPSMSDSELPFKKDTKNFAASKNNFQSGSVVDESADSQDSDDVKMMSEEHKKLLQVNRVELVQNMIPDEVLDHLLEKEVLTMPEKDRIKAEGASMNEKLIDTIMRKPDKAFSVFVEALKQTNQPHLANLLSPAKKRKQVSGRKNANAKRKVMQSCQPRSPLKTGTVTIVKMELLSEVGEIDNAGSKNILIDQPRKDNLLISVYDQLQSPSANVEVSEKSIKSLPSKVIPQSESVGDESADSQDSDDVKMMSEEHKKLLQVNRVELVQNMIPDEVFDHLLEKEVLTMPEKDRIKAEGASMNKKLIDTIMRKPDKAFSVFVDTLEQTNQPHLANSLSPAKKRKQESDENKSMTKKRKGIEPPKSAEKSKCCRMALSDIFENIAPSEATRYPLRSLKKEQST